MITLAFIAAMFVGLVLQYFIGAVPGFGSRMLLLPVIFFSITGGAVADAWDRRRVMLFTQSASGVFALSLAVLTFPGVPRPWPI